MSTSTTTTSSSTVWTPSWETGVQYGFFFDQSRCLMCFNCQITCKERQEIGPGAVRPLRLFHWETGTFPTQRISTLFAPCYHCQNPACVPLANGALIKEPNFGAVILDPAKASDANYTAALQAASAACPYGSIQFDTNADNTAYKCDMCIDQITNQQMPLCVMVCPQRALDFGPLSYLESTYGSNLVLGDGTSLASANKPSVTLKPQAAKQSVVPYDVPTALSLLGSRGSLPAIYTSTTGVTTIAPGVIARASLNMKLTGQALITATADDTG